MDPITQGALGAVAAQSISNKKDVSSALLLGWVAGMAADVDVFIRSNQDPLLALEFHRQFTHSLFFIPIAGLLCAFLLHALFGRKRDLSFLTTFYSCTIAYATHGLLDSCTSYGTLLLWPLSDQRFAWDNVSVIDPVFTVPVLACAIAAAVKKRPTLARVAIIWGACYLGLGLFQHDRAVVLATELAQQRGHTAIRVQAKPSFANLLVWKTIYETQSDFYVDAYRVGLKPTFYLGESIKKLDISRDLPWLDLSSQQAKDIERFRWFSDNYLAIDKTNSLRIVDIRYSMLPNKINGLWSINLTQEANPEAHVSYETHRGDTGAATMMLGQMILGKYQTP